MTPRATSNHRAGAVGRLFVISGPSGGGKTTAIKRLLRRVRDLARSVSSTTRAPRPGERDGEAYHFVSRTTFRRMREARELLEWAKIHGAYYGTPIDAVRRQLGQGRDVILNIDVQGARQVRRVFGQRATLIFLLPPSLDVLARRLLRRRTETPSAIRRRLDAARREIACAAWYDHIVVNDRLSEAVDRLVHIVRAPHVRARTSTRRSDVHVAGSHRRAPQAVRKHL